MRRPGRSRTLPASDSVVSTSRSVWRASSWRTTMAAKTTAGQDGEPEGGVGRVVPRDALLEDAEGDGGGGDDRQLGEVAQRQRGQGGDERGEAVGRIEREAEDGRLEEDADERQDAGHDPGDRLQAPDRDAEHGGAVAPVARRLHGDPDVGLGEPERDADQAGDRDDDGDQVVGVEDDGRDVPG